MSEGNIVLVIVMGSYIAAVEMIGRFLLQSSREGSNEAQRGKTTDFAGTRTSTSASFDYAGEKGRG